MPFRSGRASSKRAQDSAVKIHLPREKCMSASPAREKKREIRHGSQEPNRPYRIDRDDENYVKDLQRPAVIKEDLHEMGRRKRVKQVLESRNFCQSLEKIINQESKAANDDAEQLRMLHRLQSLASPVGVLSSSVSFSKSGDSHAIIADMKVSDSCLKEEVSERNKMASLIRLIDFLQWSNGMYTHISLRSSTNNEEALVNPFGLLFHEVSASTLIRTTLQGDVVDGGATKLRVNKAAFVIHSAILTGVPDVTCVIHLQSTVVTAVSSLKCGLLPICPEALILGPIGYLDYQDFENNPDADNETILKSIGDKNILVVRNNGIYVVGRTLEEAAVYAHHAVIVCETQMNAAKAGIENIVIPTPNTMRRACEVAKGSAVRWNVEHDVEWEAFMRLLDNAGLRTGHRYQLSSLRPRHLTLNSASARTISDIACPPAASALGMVNENDSDAMITHKMMLLQRENERNKWLNSPNNYQKVQLLERGTAEPKIVTKWVADQLEPSSCGTPIKISSAHQFSPFSDNPKEFKEKQVAIKENRRLGQMTAGPQSHVFDGVVYHDLSDPHPDGGPSQLSEGRSIVIGTASKGIIDRQYQMHAQVYRQLYAKNPFNTVTDDDLRGYVKEVQGKNARKSRDSGHSTTLSPQPGDFLSMDDVSLAGASRQRLKESARIDGVQDDQLLQPGEMMSRSYRDTTYDSTETTQTPSRSRTLYLDDSYLTPGLSSSGCASSSEGTLISSGLSRRRSDSAHLRSVHMVDAHRFLVRPNSQCTTASARSTAFTSDDDVHKGKEKKKGLFSFMRRGKREKAAKSVTPS